MKTIKLYISLILIILVCNIYLHAQDDSLNIGDIVTSKNIPSLNEWRNCNNITTEDRLIVDSFTKFQERYDKFILSHAFKSKCLFSELLRIESSRHSIIMEKIAANLFKLKTFNVTNGLSPTDEYLIIQDQHFAKTLGDYILPKLKYSCNYFKNISEAEARTSTSSYNKIMVLIFEGKKDFIINELKNNPDGCYENNLKLIHRSLNMVENNTNRR